MKPVELSFCKGVTSLAGLDTEAHVMEPKLDGIRLQVIIAGGEVQTYTRTEHVATGKMPAAETAMRELVGVLDGTILDGEAVYLDDNGSADFHFTTSVMGSGASVAAEKQRASGKYVSFVAFDVMFVQGTDVRGLPLHERRMLLEKIVEGFESQHIVCPEQCAPTAEAHEGRSKAMLKWKKVADEDTVVMGAAPGKGKYAGQVGAVIFGQYKNGVLVERGQCSGMDDAVRKQLTDALPVGTVMVITHNGILSGGGFRHPQFKNFRDDKRAEECTWTEEN